MKPGNRAAVQGANSSESRVRTRKIKVRSMYQRSRFRECFLIVMEDRERVVQKLHESSPYCFFAGTS
ncbi:hypothetical protein J2S04_001120 [Alicyclobacillus tengchongensis]|uniref:Uncharacterized protein n=1 Tax=Alicyclobacillus tolerans TaxID=90970 RepID=A0ABT9LVD2_9BACL|nr:hypothetical protein [Alicyclobacillus tengchongensis]